MTDPKRMTAEKQAALMLLPDNQEELYCTRCLEAYSLRDGDDLTPFCDPCAHEACEVLSEALSAERAHSVKVEARCEELRQQFIEYAGPGNVRCSWCKQGSWAEGEPEKHSPRCFIAAPTEET